MFPVLIFGYYLRASEEHSKYAVNSDRQSNLLAVRLL